MTAHMADMRTKKSPDVDHSGVQLMPWPVPVSRRRLHLIRNIAGFLVAMLASAGFAGLGLRIGPLGLISAIFIGGFIVTSVLPRFRSRGEIRRH